MLVTRQQPPPRYSLLCAPLNHSLDHTTNQCLLCYLFVLCRIRTRMNPKCVILVRVQSPLCLRRLSPHCIVLSLWKGEEEKRPRHFVDQSSTLARSPALQDWIPRHHTKKRIGTTASNSQLQNNVEEGLGMLTHTCSCCVIVPCCLSHIHNPNVPNEEESVY